jgi:hypothetical protein
MLEITEPVDREDPIFWFTHRKTRQVTKPGDLVLIDTVVGDKFGEFSGRTRLDLAAIFLGVFEDEVTRDAFERYALPGQYYPEEPIMKRMPYFTADFHVIGRIVFTGMECVWNTVDAESSS